MPVAIDPNKTTEYVLTCDQEQPEDKRTVFVIKTLTARDRAEIQDSYLAQEADGDYVSRLGTSKLLILLRGLAGWRNLRDANGREIPFDEQGRKIDRLDFLAPGWIAELAAEINRLNFMTETEKGN